MSTRTSLAHRPIGLEDFSETGSGYWMWALVPLLMLGFEFCLHLSSGELAYFFFEPAGAQFSDERPVLSILDTAVTVVLLAVVWIAYCLRPQPAREPRYGVAIVGAVVVFAVVAIIQMLTYDTWTLFDSYFRFDPAAGMNTSIEEVAGYASSPWDALRAVQVAGMLVLAEIVYRGFIVGGLIDGGMDENSAIFAGAIPVAMVALAGLSLQLLAAAAGNYLDLATFGSAGVLLFGVIVSSLLLGWLRTASRQLWPCVLVALATSPVYLFFYNFLVEA